MDSWRCCRGQSVPPAVDFRTRHTCWLIVVLPELRAPVVTAGSLASGMFAPPRSGIPRDLTSISFEHGLLAVLLVPLAVDLDEP